MSKKFILNSSVYVLADVLAKAVPFFIIPIVASYLSPEEYGNVSLFLTFIEITCLIMIWSGNGYYRAEYFKKEIDANIVFTNAIKISFILVLALQFLFLFYSLFYSFPSELYLIIPIVCFFKCFILMSLVYFQCEEKPFKVGAINLSIALMNGLLSVLLLYVGFGVDARYYAIIISIIIPSIILFSLFFDYLIKTDIKSIRANYSFGLPALPHSLSWWLRGGADSIIIYNYLGSVSLGIYSLGQQLSLILLVLANALNQALAPRVFSLLKEKKNNESKFYLIFSGAFILLISIILVLCSGVLFGFLPDSYSDSKDVFILLVFSIVGRSLTIFTGNIFYYYNKMKVLSVISVSTSLLHFLISIVVIQYFGLLGVCVAGGVIYLLTFLIQLYYIRKYNWLSS